MVLETSERRVIYDATTLRNFAAIDRLDICRDFSGLCPPPRWSQEVCDEITREAENLDIACGKVCLASWLGPPIGPTTADLAGVYALQVALGDGREPHAETLERLNRSILPRALPQSYATDDNAAYVFAASRALLGLSRVIDTVGILLANVQANAMTPAEAAEVCGDIRNAGRHLRRTHPADIKSDYFPVS